MAKASGIACFFFPISAIRSFSREGSATGCSRVSGTPSPGNTSSQALSSASVSGDAFGAAGSGTRQTEAARGFPPFHIEWQEFLIVLEHIKGSFHQIPAAIQGKALILGGLAVVQGGLRCACDISDSHRMTIDGFPQILVVLPGSLDCLVVIVGSCRSNWCR